MKLNKTLAILVAAMMLLSFASFAAAEDTSFTVTDMSGREITFDTPVEKAVALTASDCEILYAIGAGKTPRKYLRELLAVQFKVDIPIMTILSDTEEENLKRDLKLETES